MLTSQGNTATIYLALMNDRVSQWHMFPLIRVKRMHSLKPLFLLLFFFSKKPPLLIPNYRYTWLLPCPNKQDISSKIHPGDFLWKQLRNIPLFHLDREFHIKRRHNFHPTEWVENHSMETRPYCVTQTFMRDCKTRSGFPWGWSCSFRSCCRLWRFPKRGCPGRLTSTTWCEIIRDSSLLLIALLSLR